MSSIIYIMTYLFCSVVGLTLIKIGATDTRIIIENGMLFFNTKIQILIGVVLYAISFFIWIFMLAKFELSYIFPIVTGISYIIIIIISYFILKERIDLLKIIGSFFILVGVIIINMKR